MSLLTEDGKFYLIGGDHEPLNRELAPLAAKTVRLRCEVTSRVDMHLIHRRDREVERAHRKAVAEAGDDCIETRGSTGGGGPAVSNRRTLRGNNAD